MLRLPKVCRRCKTQSRDCRKCSGCGIVWYCSKHCQRDDWGSHREKCGETTKLQEEIDDIPLGPRCGYCGGWSSDIKRCGGCYDVAYCCKECQKNDWASHRAVCKREHRSEKYKGKVEMKKHKKVEMKKHEKVETEKHEGKVEAEKHEGKVEAEKHEGKVEAEKHEGKVEAEKHEGKVEAEKHEGKVEVEKHEGKVEGEKHEGKVEGEKHEGKVEVEKLEGKIEGEKHEGKVEVEKHKENGTKPLGTCGFCGKPDCSLRCTRCKDVYYCSKDCQRNHWKTHKATGCKDLHASNSSDQSSTENKTWHSFPYDSSGQLTPETILFHHHFRSSEVERIVARRPVGSLEKAKALARGRFPLTDIIDDLDLVSQENPFPFFREAQKEMCEHVLVAFMFKYHPYVYRHAIFIQDKKDEVIKVEFYLNMPLPFFTFGQIKPGNYLCLLNPLIHVFMDGTVGIRVDDPSEVSVITGQLVK